MAETPAKKRKRAIGFAAMDPELQRTISRMGGRSAHKNKKAHEFDTAEAREAGRKGGRSVSADRGHMAELGRKGAAKKNELARQRAAGGIPAEIASSGFILEDEQ